MLDKTIKALILDMDGVLWRENTPIGDLPAIFARITELGLEAILATNNSTRTVDQYLKKLSEMGVMLEPRQIVTSSMAAADLLYKKFPNGGQVFTIGEFGLIEALKERGFEPVSDDTVDNPVAVVAGMDRGISFQKLRRATLLIRGGVPFYATNPDRTFPTPEGLVPGAGSILAALTAATDVEPIVAGKPATALLELSLERLGLKPKQALMVGDRLETDIAGGQAAGCPVALMLSGVTTKKMAEDWSPKIDYIAKDLTALLK
jgi:4-nitrophenyl phosphatase